METLYAVVGDQIYPVPKIGWMNIELSLSEDEEGNYISVYWQNSDSSGIFSIRIDCFNNADGLYIFVFFSLEEAKAFLDARGKPLKSNVRYMPL